MKRSKRQAPANSIAEEIELRVVITRVALLQLFDQATRERRSSLDVLRERIERPALLAEKAKLLDWSDSGTGLRKKDKTADWRRASEKWLVLLPLALKCDVMRIARENNLTQAELGMFIVRAMLADVAWRQRAIAAGVAARRAAEEQEENFRRRFA